MCWEVLRGPEAQLTVSVGGTGHPVKRNLSKPIAIVATFLNARGDRATITLLV
jgi:hypothetical protein